MGYDFIRYYYMYEMYVRIWYVIFIRYGLCWYCDIGKGRS